MLHCQQQQRPAADKLLAKHSLEVPEATRDNLAFAIALYFERPQTDQREPGSRSVLPALRTARTHARALIGYSTRPPSRGASVRLRCTKLAAAIRTGEELLGMGLAIVGIDPDKLLQGLDACQYDVCILQRLIDHVDREELAGGARGRPWAQDTTIIRAGCITWLRAGKRIGYTWDDEVERLSGDLPAFLRDLTSICRGRPVSDNAIRTGIGQWQKWVAKTRYFPA